MRGTNFAVRFAALGDPVRLKIVEVLAARPRSVSEISGHFDMTFAGVLKHIRVLENAQIVTTVKAGRVVTCSLNRKSLESVAYWTQRQLEFWDAALLRLKRMVESDDSGD